MNLLDNYDGVENILDYIVKNFSLYTVKSINFHIDPNTKPEGDKTIVYIKRVVLYNPIDEKEVSIECKCENSLMSTLNYFVVTLSNPNGIVSFSTIISALEESKAYTNIIRIIQLLKTKEISSYI